MKREKPTAARCLYRQFLFYKNFVALEKPVIVPEGKTDLIYLRCAIRRLTAYHPRLGTIAGGKFESKIRLMNYSATIHDVLELGRGAAQLRTFIEKYDKSVSSFGQPRWPFPLSFWLTMMTAANRCLVSLKRRPRLIFPTHRPILSTISG